MLFVVKRSDITPVLSWVRPYLAIGAKPDPSLWVAIEEAGIRSVVDLNDHSDVRLEADHRGLFYAGFKVPVPTMLDDFMLFFPAVHERIEEERNARRRVYLHCTAGVYRTPTFAMAHLISRGSSIEQAESLVKKVHKQTWLAGDPKLTRADVEILQQSLKHWNRRVHEMRNRTVSIMPETGTNPSDEIQFHGL